MRCCGAHPAEGQFRKLAARHKGAFAFAATVFVLVTALAITSTVQAVRIAKERDRANQEAQTAKQVSEFLEGPFKVCDPSEARGNSITARELLDRGAERIKQELRDAPPIKSRLMLTVGRVYQGLGLIAEAEPILRDCVDVRSQHFGEDSWEFAEALAALGCTVAPGIRRRLKVVLPEAIGPRDLYRLASEKGVQLRHLA